MSQSPQQQQKQQKPSPNTSNFSHDNNSSSSSSPSPSSSSSSSPFASSSFGRVLPVLFLEYLSLALGKTLLPSFILQAFGSYSYLMVGLCETMKGILAFLACPIIGRISDRIGRKYCLLIAMMGTTLPNCILAFTNDMILYSILLGLSGLFAATFSLTFAYISDCVDRRSRAPAYGLALATFGLSFTIGPILGSYIAQEYGPHIVFLVSFLLVVINVNYIIFYLPETVKSVDGQTLNYQKLNEIAVDHLPTTWSFGETFRVFRADAFLSNIALIVFLYYSSVWAMVSTMMVYITHTLHFSPISLGWLMTAYGVSTMIAEGLLVRLVVPAIGELHTIRLGLLAFAAQCLIIAFSSSAEWIFVSVIFSLLSNLVYPSVSSLVSKVVGEHEQGEALGSLNGIKALTEGFGPLLFGLIMSLFEDTPYPGAPYIIATFIVLWAYLHSYELPLDPELVYAKYGSHHPHHPHDDRAGLLSFASDDESL
eukprot:gene8493-9363_t